MAAALDHAPACAHHADHGSVALCQRCGDYVCEACVAVRVPSPLCAPCLTRLDATPMVRQLRVLAVALIAHGAALGFVGLWFGIFGLSVGAVTAFEEESIPGDFLTSDITGVYFLGAGVVLLSAGVLQIVGGLRVWRMEGRRWALAGVLVGLLSIVSCYCFPTSVAMFGWAFVVLLRRDAAARLGMQRLAPEEATP